MSTFVRHRLSQVVLLASVGLAVPSALARSIVVESSTLRLALNDRPYSYCVIEKSTGKSLLCEGSTALTVRSKIHPVLELRNVTQSSDKVKAEMSIEGTGRDAPGRGAPDHAVVSFAFLKPEILQIQITYDWGEHR